MPALTPEQRAFLGEARRATLATTGPDGRPRLVPVCYALRPEDDAGRPVIYTPLDEKPKRSGDVHDLARVKDILVLPDVTLLIDRWDEDWARLAWLRLYGSGELLEPEPREVAEHALAVRLLRDRYPQYHGHALEMLPVICIRIDRVVGWEATPAGRPDVG
jgi:PPOX class probable F420-dependent enzyme